MRCNEIWKRDLIQLRIQKNEYGMLFKKQETCDDVFIDKNNNCLVMPIHLSDQGPKWINICYLNHKTFQEADVNEEYEEVEVIKPEFEVMYFSQDPIIADWQEHKGHTWRSSNTHSNYHELYLPDFFNVIYKNSNIQAQQYFNQNFSIQDLAAQQHLLESQQQLSVWMIVVVLIPCCIVSSFAVYPIELWRVRRQVFSIIKRFNSFFYSLQQQRTSSSGGGSGGSQGAKLAKKHHAEECFIDEFGWSVFIRGVAVEIISTLLYTLVVILVTCGSYQELISARSIRQLSSSSTPANNSPFSIKTIIVSLIIGILNYFITYQTQEIKIKLQFQDDQSRRKQQPSSSSKNKKKEKDEDDQDNNSIYKTPVLKDGLDQVYGWMLPKRFVEMIGSQRVMALIESIIFHLLFIPLFLVVCNVQQSQYRILFKRSSMPSSITSNQALAGYIFEYIFEYVIYRSPILPLLFSSIIAVTMTQYINIFQTQFICYQYAFKHLQEKLVDRVSYIDEEQLMTFPKKFVHQFKKNRWNGFLARLLYFPLRLLIISLCYLLIAIEISRMMMMNKLISILLVLAISISMVHCSNNNRYNNRYSRYSRADPLTECVSTCEAHINLLYPCTNIFTLIQCNIEKYTQYFKCSVDCKSAFEHHN
ncbi:hypothetical protein DFA_11084 [Cavenderia fasciculata]|uniref:Transmembrane protein n=1 Tax=Cavenderia fasciculata TaxID=261658 RepID=F4QER2_CACFS|nr:uncharacterized protein DFA_11084 [Cavenderia fasciculata]EGG13323.1 hypothetical protein DFA_11084 [Cavenderia fasciculata]|eukprot:XP_004350022.1 hypothetical protein DFA_11084 [Cavenderia fasciculata]